MSPVFERRPPPRSPSRADRTQPGGPSPEVLAAARVEAAADGTLAGTTGRRRPIARLLVIAGPRNGAECALTEGVTTLGRGGDNAFVIPDLSVSRRHSRIERDGKSWVLFDEGSGNGTRVGGQGVKRKKLRDGDRIEMGDTVAQFVAPGGIVARGTSRKPGGGRRKLVASAVAAALSTAAAAGLAVHGQRLRGRDELRVEREETRALARRRLDQARLLLASGNVAEALMHLRVAAELAPDAEIARTLATVELEQGAGAAPAAAVVPPPRAEVRPLRSSRSLVAATVRLERRPSAAQELDLAVAATDDELPAAAAHARAAVAADPASAAARHRQGELQTRIHDLYLRAYVVREDDREEARKAFRLVIAALPADDETAQKAKRWLDKIEGKAAE